MQPDRLRKGEIHVLVLDADLRDTGLIEGDDRGAVLGAGAGIGHRVVAGNHGACWRRSAGPGLRTGGNTRIGLHARRSDGAVAVGGADGDLVYCATGTSAGHARIDVEQRERDVAYAARLREGKCDVDVLPAVGKSRGLQGDLQVVLRQVAIEERLPVGRVAGGEGIAGCKRAIRVTQRKRDGDGPTRERIAAARRARSPGLLVPVERLEHIVERALYARVEGDLGLDDADIALERPVAAEVGGAGQVGRRGDV